MAKPVIEYRLGRRIRVPEIRVIGPEGEQLGVMTVEQAMLIAERNGLDLVEVAAKAIPPVCRIMDYGKFKYEQAKKTRGQKSHSAAIQVKEIKFRPKTEEHDMDFKLRHIRRFLGEGHKVRLAVAFRGREVAHPEIGHQLLGRIVKQLAEIAAVEQPPAMEAKRLMLTIAPKLGVVQRAPTTGAAPSPQSTSQNPKSEIPSPRPTRQEPWPRTR